MEVMEEDYQYFARERERTRYLKKLSGQFELSYDALTTDIFNGEEILLDEEYCVEEIVEQKQLLNKITEALKLLTEDERRLIQVIYIETEKVKESMRLGKVFHKWQFIRKSKECLNF